MYFLFKGGIKEIIIQFESDLKKIYIIFIIFYFLKKSSLISKVIELN